MGVISKPVHRLVWIGSSFGGPEQHFEISIECYYGVTHVAQNRASFTMQTNGR